MDVRGIEGWWSQGERILITLGEAERTIFVRRLGAGPSMTLLHGFPSCSYDWAGVAGPLAERYSLLLPDLLGFGASDKPTDHDYSIRELREALAERAERDHETTSSVIRKALRKYLQVG